MQILFINRFKLDKPILLYILSKLALNNKLSLLCGLFLISLFYPHKDLLLAWYLISKNRGVIKLLCFYAFYINALIRLKALKPLY